MSAVVHTTYALINADFVFPGLQKIVRAKKKKKDDSNLLPIHWCDEGNRCH